MMNYCVFYFELLSFCLNLVKGFIKFFLILIQEEILYEQENNLNVVEVFKV